MFLGAALFSMDRLAPAMITGSVLSLSGGPYPCVSKGQLPNGFERDECDFAVAPRLIFLNGTVLQLGGSAKWFWRRIFACSVWNDPLSIVEKIRRATTLRSPPRGASHQSGHRFVAPAPKSPPFASLCPSLRPHRRPGCRAKRNIIEGMSIIADTGL